MKANVFVPLAAAALVIALAPCTAAAARPAARHPGPKRNVRKTKPSIDESFEMLSSNGFGLIVSLHDRHKLTIEAVPLHGSGIVSTSYSMVAPQQSRSQEIKANLGRFGSIEVHFVPESSHHEKALESCSGGRPKVEEGRFVGRIDFRGESGYTSVRTKGAWGAVKTVPPLTCKPDDTAAELKKLLHELHKLEREAEKEKKEAGAPEKTEPEPEHHLVKLEAKLKRDAGTFVAARSSVRKPNGKSISFTSFGAGVHRRLGRIEESSGAVGLFEPGSVFKVPDITHLTREGVIEPPPPFEGSGTYRREPHGRLLWTGDLSVNLPGFGNVRLAGHAAVATVCADTGCGV